MSRSARERRNGPRLRRSSVFVLPLALFLMLGAARAARPASELPTIELGGRTCGVPPTVRRLPTGLELDTLWYRFGPALRGCRVLNRKDRWVAECAWFYMEGPHGGVYRMEELDSLHAIGRITDSTLFTNVRYRYLIEAASIEDAKREARARWPRTAPRAVYRMLLAQVGSGGDSVARADRPSSHP